MITPDGFIEDYPVMLNRDIAEKYGISISRVYWLSRINGLRKCPDFLKLTKERRSSIMSAILQVNGIRNGFKKGNHVRSEYRKGHKVSQETRKKISESMRNAWKMERLRQEYGLERKTKLRIK